MSTPQDRLELPDLKEVFKKLPQAIGFDRVLDQIITGAREDLLHYQFNAFQNDTYTQDPSPVFDIVTSDPHYALYEAWMKAYLEQDGNVNEEKAVKAYMDDLQAVHKALKKLDPDKMVRILNKNAEEALERQPTPEIRAGSAVRPIADVVDLEGKRGR